MAFQTSVLRDGAWVTETVNLHAVLKSRQPGPKGPRPDSLKPQRCGLLTRTLVESAVANQILPVRLRSPGHNDIAFVGDHFVQICELQNDGRLKEIARKNDFGSRIRNACVVGSFVVPELKGETGADSSSLPAFKTEDDQAGIFSFTPPRPFLPPGIQLPPQFLMVALESGDNIFLFVRPGPDGKPTFVSSRFSSPKHMKLGFHVAVDPSSRYMALAGPEGYFGIYELEFHTQLQRYLDNKPLHFVRSFRLRSVRGVIHKMTFLYPRMGDDHHIILLLVVVRRGKSRTVIYEWEFGNDLKVVLSEEKKGHRMPVELEMPLLLIPLRFQSAFIVITSDGIAVCNECLHGPPRYETQPNPTAQPSVHHRGRHYPLWTAWSRPFRNEVSNSKYDRIYLAREDGLVMFLTAGDDCDISSMITDTFPCNISGAFACLFDYSTDVLVLGNDFGSGGYWKILPRVPPELLGTLPNWAPVVDFTTTDEFTAWHPAAHPDKAMAPWQQAGNRKPDRVFATCDGGSKGSITEYRYGLKANIGLDLEYGPGMKQAWLLPFCDQSLASGYLLLLSMPDATTALLLPSDFSSATAPAEGAIPYDLSSATLTLVSSGRLTAQVTKKNIVLVNQHQSVSIPCQALPSLSNASVSDAYVLDDCVAVSAHTDAQFQIHVFKVDPDLLTLALVQTIDVDGEVTCLSLGANYTILAGIRDGSQTFLGCGSLQQPFTGLQMIDLTQCLLDKSEYVGPQVPSAIEGIESIAAVGDKVLLGTRSGEVIVVKVTAGSVSIDWERFGTTTAQMSCSYRAGSADPTILITCDKTLISIGVSKHDTSMKHESKHRVVPTDASKLDALAPPVHFATGVDMPAEDGVAPILIISGSRLLLAEMHKEPGLVHRSIPVEGSPNRVMYCQFTQCLVAAVNRPDGPTLAFIHPDTGEDIGVPTDKNKDRLPCINGLGKAEDRIFGLAEWNYRRAGNVWNFILVTTRSGRLIVVTTEKLAGRGGGPPTYLYLTRFKKQVPEPIYSVVGYDEGVIYCAGQTIHWEVLDTEEKRLKPLKSFTLGSPATSLRISNGKLLAMTNSESLVVLDNLDASEANTRLCHVDPWRRNGVDFFEVAGPQQQQQQQQPEGESDPVPAPDPSGGLTLVADRERGVTGLWVPWQTPDRECEVVLEAELPCSIRRFRRGRTRMVWEQRLHAPRFGRLAATVDDAEVLGVSLNGALTQFVLLGVEAWRLLRWVQNLAAGCEEVCPFAVGLGRPQLLWQQGAVDVEPKLAFGGDMHVDGDVLGRCLERRALERVVVGEGHVARLRELLGELDGGRHTAGWAAEGDDGRYFGLAYQVLEYYLSPAL